MLFGIIAFVSIITSKTETLQYKIMLPSMYYCFLWGFPLCFWNLMVQDIINHLTVDPNYAFPEQVAII